MIKIGLVFYQNTGLFFSLSLEVDDFLFPLIDCGHFFLCSSELQDVLYSAVQYQAQLIQGVGAYRFSMAHSS